MSNGLYFSTDRLNAFTEHSMVAHLGIKFTHAEDGYLEAEMPVDKRTMQPFGILHGGATMALAETVGSGLSVIHVNPDEYSVKGLEINGNHLKSVDTGKVIAKAVFLHRGQNTHVVEIRTFNMQNQLVAVARITNFIQARNLQQA